MTQWTPSAPSHRQRWSSAIKWAWSGAAMPVRLGRVTWHGRQNVLQLCPRPRAAGSLLAVRISRPAISWPCCRVIARLPARTIITQVHVDFCAIGSAVYNRSLAAFLIGAVHYSCYSCTNHSSPTRETAVNGHQITIGRSARRWRAQQRRCLAPRVWQWHTGLARHEG